MDTPEARLNQYLDQMEAAVRGGDEVGEVDVTQIADDIDSLLNPDVAEDEGGRFEMGRDLPGRTATQAEPEPEKAEAGKEGAGEEEGEDAATKDAEGEEGEEPFVEAADGKARIPYSVLQGERARRQELEARLRALEEGVGEQGRRDESDEPGDQAGEAEQGLSIDERIEAIKDLVPDEVAELLSSMGEALKVSSERTRFYEERELEREQVARDSRLNAVQEAIDSIPVLAEWQAADGDEWAEAVALDSALRALPKYAQMPAQDRFKEVVRRMGGRLDDGGEQSTSKAGDGGGQRPARPTPRDVPPTTLSDIPGGTPPEQSERDTIDKSDVTELYAQMERMTPDQISALLARVA